MNSDWWHCAEESEEQQLAEGLEAFHNSGQRDQAALLAAAEFSFSDPDMAEVQHRWQTKVCWCTSWQ